MVNYLTSKYSSIPIFSSYLIQCAWIVYIQFAEFNFMHYSILLSWTVQEREISYWVVKLRRKGNSEKIVAR